jgi:hypothetical protein
MHSVSTDEDQVSLFFSFFKTGIAGDWATKRLTEYDEDQENSRITANDKRWTTLKEVRVQFKKDFKAIAADAEACNIIQKAKMSTMSCLTPMVTTLT